MAPSSVLPQSHPQDPEGRKGGPLSWREARAWAEDRLGLGLTGESQGGTYCDWTCGHKRAPRSHYNQAPSHWRETVLALTQSLPSHYRQSQSLLRVTQSLSLQPHSHFVYTKPLLVILSLLGHSPNRPAVSSEGMWSQPHPSIIQLFSFFLSTFSTLAPGRMLGLRRE